MVVHDQFTFFFQPAGDRQNTEG